MTGTTGGRWRNGVTQSYIWSMSLIRQPPAGRSPRVVAPARPATRSVSPSPPSTGWRRATSSTASACAGRPSRSSTRPRATASGRRPPPVAPSPRPDGAPAGRPAGQRRVARRLRPHADRGRADARRRGHASWPPRCCAPPPPRPTRPARRPAEVLAAAQEIGLPGLGVPEALGGIMEERSAMAGTLVAEALAQGRHGPRRRRPRARRRRHRPRPLGHRGPAADLPARLHRRAGPASRPPR